MHLDLESDDVEAKAAAPRLSGATRKGPQQECGYDFWVLCALVGLCLHANFPDLLAQRRSRQTSADP
jgi:hypothetical protein